MCVRNQNTPPFPLPQRIVPYPNEDLVSIICRAARKMKYAHPQWILHIQDSTVSIKSTELPILSEPQSYQLLERLLLLDKTILYQHTLHSFASLQFPDDLNSSLFTLPLHQQKLDAPIILSQQINLPRLDEKILHHYFLHLSYTKVCPLCLREEDAYDRLYWRMTFAFYCPHHRVPLREHCPSCQEKIPAFRPLAFLCPKCEKGDYRHSSDLPASEDHFSIFAQLLFLRAWDIVLPEWESLQATMTLPQLSNIDSTIYFFLFQHLYFAFLKDFSQKELSLLLVVIGSVSQEEMLASFRGVSQEIQAFFLFHALFFQWPSRFFTFLDILYRVAQPPCTWKKDEFIVLYCKKLFYTQRIQQQCPWLCEAYAQHYSQFCADFVLTQARCQEINQLAEEHEGYFNQDKHATPTNSEEIIAPFRPLPVFVIPYYWESIPSLLSRGARKKGICSPIQILKPAFTPHRLLSLDQPCGIDLQILSYLLQLDKEDIQTLALDRFIIPLEQEQKETLLQNQISDTISHFFSQYSDNTAICPLCLQEDYESYDRIYWKVYGVSACLKHHILLLRTCPFCNKKIPTLRLSSYACCPFCYEAYVKAVPSLLHENNILFIETCFLLDHLGVSVTNQHFKSYFASSPLADLGSSCYFYLLRDLSINFSQMYSNSYLLKLLQDIYPDFYEEIHPHQENLMKEKLVPVILFHVLFTDWPSRFYALLDFLYRTHPRSYIYAIDECRKMFERQQKRILFPWLLNAFDDHQKRFCQSDWFQQMDERDAQKYYD